MNTYVVSDMHGQKNLFDHVLQQANFSAQDHLYVLGDAIDRGFDGIKLLQQIAATPNMTLLLGNHEYMMLNAIDQDGNIKDADAMYLWTDYNGGRITYKHFMKLSASEKHEIYQMLLNCPVTIPLTINNQQYYLTHACPNIPEINDRDPNANTYQQFTDRAMLSRLVWNSPYRTDDRTWINPNRYPNADRANCSGLPVTTICGHVRVQKMLGYFDPLQYYKDPNWPIIDIDGGCKNWDEISAQYGIILLRLDDMKAFYYSFEDEYLSGINTTQDRYIENTII